MYAQMLKAQWRSMGAIVVVLAVVAFATPLMTVLYGGNLRQSSSYAVANWLAAAAAVGTAMPVIALVVGVLLGLAVWSADQLGEHVYALSLPLARWRYVLLRFGVGLAFVAAPALALTAGSLIAASAVDLPDGLHAYPLPLALRFTVASVVCYALIFALSTATRRVALALLGGVGGLTLADVLLTALGKSPVVIGFVFQLLTTWPGPLAILMGRWALFDV